MGGRRRGRVQRGLEHRADLPLGDARPPARPRGILLQAGYAQGQEPLAPQLDGRSRDAQTLRDLLARDAVGRQLDNPSPFDHAGGMGSAPGPQFQRDDLVCGEHNGGRVSAHAPTIAEVR